jgi:hypothetical protein
VLCNPISHLCTGCTTDLQCMDNVYGTSHCDVPSGTCQCASDDDCTDPDNGIPGTDKCVHGTCSCSSAAVCTDYPSATAKCQ